MPLVADLLPPFQGGDACYGNPSPGRCPGLFLSRFQRVQETPAKIAGAQNQSPKLAHMGRSPWRIFGVAFGMAQYEHLPIYKAAFDLQIYFEGIVKNFSRYHKYTHGAALRGVLEAL